MEVASAEQFVARYDPMVVASAGNPEADRHELHAGPLGRSVEHRQLASLHKPAARATLEQRAEHGTTTKGTAAAVAAHSAMRVAIAGASVPNPEATRHELHAEPLAWAGGQRQALSVQVARASTTLLHSVQGADSV